MIAANKHSIQNANIEFEFPTINSDDLNGSDFVEWTKENILEAIDYHASRLTDSNQIIQVAELNIKLDLKADRHFFKESKDLKEEINRNVLTALKKAIQDNKNSKISLQQHHYNVILKFIESGQVEELYANQEWQLLIDSFYNQLMYLTEAEVAKLLSANIQPTNFYRFYDLLGIDKLISVLAKLSTEGKAIKWLQAFQKLFEKHPQYFKSKSEVEFFYQVVLQLILEQKSFDEFLKLITKNRNYQEIILTQLTKKEQINIFSKGSTLPSILDEKLILKEDIDISKLEESGLFVGQAGLILFAPFLPEFFKKTGYIKKDAPIENQLEWPILLHYLATGETTAPEWKLTLPKLLSGLKLGQHCSTEIFPTKVLDQQIDEILSSVIEHWPELKNTSPEGLRNTFLIREGQLKNKNGFYYLYINEKPFDILLSFIPWNYSTIKLDWMSTLLFVEWRK